MPPIWKALWQVAQEVSFCSRDLGERSAEESYRRLRLASQLQAQVGDEHLKATIAQSVKKGVQ